LVVHIAAAIVQRTCVPCFLSPINGADCHAAPVPHPSLPILAYSFVRALLFLLVVDTLILLLPVLRVGWVLLGQVPALPHPNLGSPVSGVHPTAGCPAAALVSVCCSLSPASHWVTGVAPGSSLQWPRLGRPLAVPCPRGWDCCGVRTVHPQSAPRTSHARSTCTQKHRHTQARMHTRAQEHKRTHTRTHSRNTHIDHTTTP
jgi:hypothetical protein